MSTQRSQFLTATYMGSLLSPQAKAVTVGPIVWRSDRGVAQRGAVDVTTVMSDLRPCSLEIRINPLSPSEPKLVYLVGSASERFAARRLCVNAPHRPYTGTHKHIAAIGGGEDQAYEPTDIPQVPLAPRVAPGVYRAILEAFANECHVTMGSDFVWTEP